VKTFLENNILAT